MKLSEVKIGQTYLVCFPDVDVFQYFEAEAIHQVNQAIVVKHGDQEINVNPSVLKEISIRCMYCGNPPEAFHADFIIEDDNTAYHDLCPQMYEARYQFEYEKRLQHAIVDAAIDWYVNHIYDEIDPLPYDEIINDAIKSTPMNVEQTN